MYGMLKLSKKNIMNNYTFSIKTKKKEPQELGN